VRTLLLLQIGEFGDILFALYAMRDSYSLWHLAHINQALFCEFTEKSKGVLPPFLVGCHSSIISGRLNPNELHIGHHATFRERPYKNVRVRISGNIYGMKKVLLSWKDLLDGYASDFSTKIEARIISGQLLRKL